MAGTRSAAEAILRDLPSVVGASVREDVNGHPREIHLLVDAGADARALSRDIRDLLEERLEVPVDQRVISIAQLARNGMPHPHASREAAEQQGADRPDRLTLTGTETRRGEGRVTVVVHLEEEEGTAHEGEASEPDVGQGHARAAARAALLAATRASASEIRLELESLTAVRLVDREVLLVTVAALSRRLGRKPRILVGAHPVDSHPELAAVLAVLKAANRTLERAG